MDDILWSLGKGNNEDGGHSNPLGNGNQNKLHPATIHHGDTSSTNRCRSLAETKKDGVDHRDEGMTVAMPQVRTSGYKVSNRGDLLGEAKGSLQGGGNSSRSSKHKRRTKRKGRSDSEKDALTE